MPLWTTQRPERKTLIAVNHFAIRQALKPLAQALNGREHIVGVTALAHLLRAPLGDFSGAPGLAGLADGGVAERLFPTV